MTQGSYIPPSEVQEGHVKISADYPWRRQLSVLKRAQFLF